MPTKSTIQSVDRDGRQAQIFAWAKQAFTTYQATSLPQRGLRLLEEAIEAFQTVGGDPAQAHELVDYVFGRPAGVLHQELGGVGVTLLALAAAAGLSADEEEAREVARVLSKPVEELTRRNAAKNEAGFLARQRTVTFPVELEEDEAGVLGALIREKYMPERSHHSMPDGPSRLLRKVHDVMRKFHEKRIADAEFAASLTEEERDIIRTRRANAGRTDG